MEPGLPGIYRSRLSLSFRFVAEGDFIRSLNCVDIHTAWTETRAVMGRGQRATLKALEEVKSSLPFTLKGIDSDNAHIEQKSWTHTRKIFGYLKYEAEEALELII